MAMGRPKGPPSRPLNVRIETADLDKLSLIYKVTGKPTADVIRDAVKLYIKLHDSQLREAQQMISGEGKRTSGQWGFTREEVEAAEEAAKPENHYDSRKEWDDN